MRDNSYLLGLLGDRYWQEWTARVSYVAISRVKTLASSVIEPMTYKRLTSLKSSANLLYRLQEEDRLDQLVETTNSGALR